MRSVKIKTKTRMRVYTFSFGETYYFRFGYDPEKKRTYITVEIDYSVFGGRGFIWMLPQETLDTWAKKIGCIAVKLESKQTPAFIEKQTLLTTLNSRPIQIVDKYCALCGYKGTSISQFCGCCGAEMLN